MKNTVFAKLKTIILLLGVGLVALTALTSCENFLNNKQVKDEILDVIAYNNAQQCTVVFRSDIAYGEFLGSVERTFHVGYESEVQFELNKDDYVFKGLEAVSQSDKTTSRSDCVEFKEISKDNKKGIYKYSVKLLKNSKDVLIRPVCIALPKISAVQPKFESNGCPQNTAIQITFNKAIDPQTFDPACISIYSDENLKDYFEPARLTSDNKSIYIAPVNDKLILPPDEIKSTANIEVNYDFTSLKDENGLALTELGTHTYKINKSFDKQKKVNVQVQSNLSFGSFITSGLIECTVGYTFDVQFTLNKDSYKFLDFAAVSSQDNSVLRGDCITIESKAYDEKAGIYKAKIRVVKEQDDILVYPDCLLLPAIQSFSPAVNTQVNSANTVITINFNMAMEDETVTPATSIFNYNNILINCDSFDIDKVTSDYFELPVFDSTKKILTIRPRPLELIDCIGQKPFIEITISFSPQIKVQCDNEELSLVQNENSSFKVRYNAQKEETSPTEINNSFFATREEISFEKRESLNTCLKFTEEKFDDIYSYNSNDVFYSDQTENAVVSKLMQNRVTDYFYIYGKYYDKDSGVKKVVVTQEGCVSKEYTASSDNVEFISDDDGYTEFIIKHNLKKTNDSYNIEVVVLDGCGNPSESKSFFVISRSSYNGYSDVGFTNHYLNFESKDINYYIENEPYSLINNYRDMSVEEFLDEYEKNSKNLKIDYEYFFLKVYKNIYIHNRNVELYCEYTDKLGNPRNEKFEDCIDEEDYWCLDLDVDSMAGTEFTIHVKDEFGAEGYINFEPLEKEFLIPYYDNGINRGVTFTSGAAHNGFVIKKDGSYSSTLSQGQGRIDVDEDNIAGFIYWNEYGICSDYIEYVIPNSIIEVSSNYVTSFDEFNHLNITFTFGQNTWEKFDFIYCIVRNEYNSDFPYGGITSFKIYPEDTYIDTQTNKVIYTCKKVDTYYENEDGFIFENNVQFVFIGAKSCYIPDQVPDNEYPAVVTITPLIEADYDEMPPEIIVKNSIEITNITSGGYTNSNENHYITFILQDVGNGSGPDYAIINVGGKDYELNAENNYQKKFSANELYKYVTTYNKYSLDRYKIDYSYEAYDNKGNKKSDDTCIEWLLDDYLRVSTSSNQKELFLFSSNSFSIDATKVFIQSSDKYWRELPSYTVEYDTFSATITIPETSSYDFTNKWVKVSAVETVMSYPDYAAHNPPSVYEYTGTIPNTKGKYNYMTKNGNSKDSMVISSDAPVYVCTITTDYEYENWKDWNAQDWTFFGKEVDRAFLSVPLASPVSDTVPVSQKYQIKSDNYKTIESGQYYVIIAHFANDDIVMSEVMQK